MTEKNNEIRPSNLTIMHSRDNFASFLSYTPKPLFKNVVAYATRAASSDAIFHDICPFSGLNPFAS